jgi:multidrug efflux pump subunit AcrA (membrane-fusion protein)
MNTRLPVWLHRGSLLPRLASSRLSRRRMAVLACAAVVAVAGAGIGLWAASGNSAKSSGRTTTFAVRTGPITVTTSASGTVQPIDSRALTFGTSGTVRTLAVKAGDHVTAGETLATLDPTDAQSAVSSAQSSLDAANSNLTLAEQQATQVTQQPAGGQNTGTQGGCLSAADFVLSAPTPQASASASPQPTPTPSAHPSPSPSTQPPTTRQPTATPHPTGTRTCGTGSGGSGSGSGSGGSGSGGSGSGGSGAGAGQSQNSGTDSLLRAQQAVNNAELALQQAQARLAGTTIVAPSAGRVLSVAGSVGQTASAGGSGFIVMGGVNSLAVEAEFSEADVAAVAVGQHATVTLADHPGVTYNASVTEIDPAGTASGQLVRYGVQLEFANPPADLLLGQSAVAAVVTASTSNVPYIPSAALANLNGNSATVRVRTPTGDVTRAVTVGLAGDQGTQITSGLVAGDVVVVPTK